MERFSVSGDLLRAHYSESTILSQVFNDIERELQAENRVVCQFIVNGMALEEKDEGRFAAFKLSDIHTLEYLAEASEVLVVDVLDSWLAALPELIERCEALSGQIRQGQTQGILKAVHDLVDNCRYLFDSVISTRQIMGDSLGAGVEGLSEAEKMTRETVKRILGHIESQDFVQLSLSIEYDLNHALVAWENILKTFKSLLSHGDGRANGANAAHSLDRRTRTH